jgi:hypothetical protein
VNKRKAATFLALILLGLLLISCLKSSLIVSNPPRSLHGEGGTAAETQTSQAAAGAGAPDRGGSEDGRTAPAVASGPRSSSQAGGYRATAP